MNYIRIVLFSLLTWLGWWISSDNVSKAFGPISSIVEVSGVLNVWAGFCSIIAGLYLVIYSIKDEFKLSIPIGEINKVIIVSTLIVSPLLTIAIYSQMQSVVSSYVECKSERKISSRYSSRTYAVSEELCSALDQHE
ncbi:hypothetical protein ACPDLO_003146 [Vibrio cholerae]|uniref:hypothetical protein n=1 Tax=Vibrio sp. RC586 TaxID=675815 RepID=UPI0012EA4CAF|nr:hypothetical protein [Vibrio sp. RC586]